MYSGVIKTGCGVQRPFFGFDVSVQRHFWINFGAQINTQDLAVTVLCQQCSQPGNTFVHVNVLLAV